MDSSKRVMELRIEFPKNESHNKQFNVLNN